MRGSVVMPLEAEFCIVGAGPAGLVLANQLGKFGREVVLLESGFASYDESAQALNRGRVLGDPYADLRSVRRRQLGGTVNLWNTEVQGRKAAKYVPLDPIDFEARPEAGLPGWPIGYAELVPWYAAAQRVCGLGPFEYGDSWIRDGVSGPTLVADSGLQARIYQLGLAEALSTTLVEALRGWRGVSIECGGTAAHLRIGGSDQRADAIVVRSTRGGERRILRAETFVLAAGAIENARLLLASGGPASRSEWLGRNFMEHPRDYSMRWIPRDPAILRDLGFFDQHETEGGTNVMGRLAVGEASLRERGLPQASVTLLPQFRSANPWWRHLADAIGVSRGTRYPRGGAGWSGRLAEEEVTGVQLLLNLEQAPHRDNGVSLPPPGTAHRDGSVRLEWRWRAEDQTRLEAVREVVADAFEASGQGLVRIDARLRPDPNAHHHAGTTRMSDDPVQGVVNRHGRVHGLENVYCTGASVFPSAGFANPTLTIVALALRLAAHLDQDAGASLSSGDTPTSEASRGCTNRRASAACPARWSLTEPGRCRS